MTYNSYTALGKPLLVTFNNGVTTQYQYYPENNRLKKIYTTNGTGLMNLEYFYDNIGNITLLTDSLDSNKTRSYKYDDLDRLIESDSPSYGGKLIYQYDKIGNMTYNCKFGHYYYEDANHVHAVTSVRKSDGTLAAEYQYDGNGNMIHSHDYGISVSRDFSYDYDNMPTSIVANSGAVISKYNAFGTRVTKTVPVVGTTKYIGQIYECSSTGCTKYIFSGLQRIAEIDSTGIHYYHTDHLGSSTVLTDQSGAKAQEVYYYPYGEIHTNSISNVTDYLYTGKEWDAETGLYYYGARYYDPKLARFISADTIVPEPFFPQTLNRYAYAYNNPIVLRDLDGHCADAWSTITSWFSSGWSAFTSAASSFVTTVTTTAVSMAANFAATVAATVVGLATGFNATAMNSVVGSILGGANTISGGIAGVFGGEASVALFNGFGDGGGSSGNMYAEAGAYDVKPMSKEEEVASFIFGETSGLRPGESTPEELAQAREAWGSVVINRMSKGLNPGYSDTPNSKISSQMQQWNQSLNAARNALKNTDATGGALNINIREASQTNPTTRPHSSWGLSVYQSYGPFYNVGGGDVRKGSVYINVYK